MLPGPSSGIWNDGFRAIKDPAQAAMIAVDKGFKTVGS
jgi:hypothetical protein